MYGDVQADWNRAVATAGSSAPLTLAQQQQNVNELRAWLDSHPLPPGASADQQRARALVEAAYQVALAKVTQATAAQQAAARRAFDAERSRYQQFTHEQLAAESPHGFWDDLGAGAQKLLKIGALVAGAALVGPPLIRSLRRGA